MHKVDVNFFKALELSRTTKKANIGSTVAGVLLIVLVCSINIVMYMYLDYSNKQANIQISEHISYTANPQNMEKQHEYRKLKAEIEAMQKATEGIKMIDVEIDKLEKFNLDFYNSVMNIKPARVTITDILFNSDALEIRCTTTDNSPPADYALALDSSDIFEEITYEGFEAEGGLAENSIKFTVKCKIKRGDNNEN